MRKKPLIIQLIGWGLILSPIYYYIQFYLLKNMFILDVGLFFTKNSIARLCGIFSAPLVGIFVLMVKKTGWYLFIGYCVLTIGLNISFFLRGGQDFRMSDL